MREAGALALSMFRTELKNWTKGASSPVSEADIAVNDLIEQRLRAATPDYGWLSEESADDDSASRQAAGLDRRSDRRHPRLSRRPRGLVRQRGAGRGRRAGAGGGVRAGHRRILLRRSRGQGATRNDGPVRATAGTELDFSRMAGPKPLVQRLSPSPDEITLHPRIGSLALRLCRVADGSLDAAFAGGQSRDWDLAAANLIVQEANGRMTALSGDAIEYNRREVVHGVLVAAGQRSSCAHCRAFPKSSAALNRSKSVPQFIPSTPRYQLSLLLAGHLVRKDHHAR